MMPTFVASLAVELPIVIAMLTITASAAAVVSVRARRGARAYAVDDAARALRLERSASGFSGVIRRCHVDLGEDGTIRVRGPRRLDLVIHSGRTLGPLRTGDEAFDEVVSVSGSRIEAAIALVRAARRAVRLAVLAGWRHEDGHWVLRVTEGVGPIATRVREGVEMVRSLSWEPAGALPRLLATLRTEPAVETRALALFAMAEAFPTAAETTAALAEHAASEHIELARVALAHGRDVRILERAVVDRKAPVGLRLIAFERLAEVARSTADSHVELEQALFSAALAEHGEDQTRARTLLRRIGTTRSIALLERALGAGAAHDIAAIRERLGGVALHGRLSLTDGRERGALRLVEEPAAAVDAGPLRGKLPS